LAAGLAVPGGHEVGVLRLGADPAEIRMAPLPEPATGEAAAAGASVGPGGLAQQGAGDGKREILLADAGLALDQQRMMEGRPRCEQAHEFGLMPGIFHRILAQSAASMDRMRSIS